MDDLWVPRMVEVAEVLPETADQVTLKLAPAGDELPAFKPGQFNMLYAFGAGESAISISGPPPGQTGIWHTLRKVGGVTNLLGSLGRGGKLGLRGPFGSYWPLEAARGKRLLVVAGGIGLAPLRSVVYAYLNDPGLAEDLVLVYGARAQEELLYFEEMSAYQTQGKLRLLATVDRPSKAWWGSIGVVTDLLPKAVENPEETLALVCGPELMIRYAVQRLVDLGLAKSSIHVSLERNMRCGMGLCGHCQLGGVFVCKEGPVFSYDQVETLMNRRGA